MTKNSNIFQGELSKSTVFLNKDIITPHYMPKKLPFREKQIEEMVSSLSNSLKNQKSDNLFIYGKTGTGKTSTTRFVLNQLKNFAEEQKASIETVYVNCRNYNSKYKVLSKIIANFYPEKEFTGFSSSFVYEKMTNFVEENNTQLIIALDEIDKLKELDDLIYSLTRANDELNKGGIGLIGISNQLTFKDKLDPRTKSSLCEKEMVFPPYNAEEIRAILNGRIKKAFKPETVEESAINLASAIASKESGDARTAVMLLLRAGEQADKNKTEKITDKEVQKARKKVEEQIIFDMISTLPEQEQLVLYTIANLTIHTKGVKRLGKENEKAMLLSGEIYDEYNKMAKNFEEKPVSQKWFGQYLTELNMYGLINSTISGKGQRGTARIIQLVFDPVQIKKTIEKELNR